MKINCIIVFFTMLTCQVAVSGVPQFEYEGFHRKLSFEQLKAVYPHSQSAQEVKPDYTYLNIWVSAAERKSDITFIGRSIVKSEDKLKLSFEGSRHSTVLTEEAKVLLWPVTLLSGQKVNDLRANNGQHQALAFMCFAIHARA